jgi:hypothetical protein
VGEPEDAGGWVAAADSDVVQTGVQRAIWRLDWPQSVSGRGPLHPAGRVPRSVAVRTGRDNHLQEYVRCRTGGFELTGSNVTLWPEPKTIVGLRYAISG